MKKVWIIEIADKVTGEFSPIPGAGFPTRGEAREIKSAMQRRSVIERRQEFTRIVGHPIPRKPSVPTLAQIYEYWFGPASPAIPPCGMHTACIEVAASFCAPSNATPSCYWNKGDKLAFAREVQRVMRGQK